MIQLFDLDTIELLRNGYNIQVCSVEREDSYSDSIGRYMSSPSSPVSISEFRIDTYRMDLKGTSDGFHRLLQDIENLHKEHELRKQYPSLMEAYKEYEMIKRMCLGEHNQR